VQNFLNNLPEDFVKSRDGLLNISSMKSEIESTVLLGKGLESVDIPISAEKVAELMSKTTSLLDPARGLKEKISKITSSSSSFQMQKISKVVKNPQDINDLIFLQNKDFLEQV
jgi:hypothetical protein